MSDKWLCLYFWSVLLRFIRRGFATAVWASEPEVVVFLGDLLNDGSVVEDEDFDVMAEYFHASFRLPPSVKVSSGWVLFH